MDFVSPEQTPEKNQTITSGSFWPTLNSDHYRETMRQDGTVTIARLIEVLTNAVIETNRQLATWRQQKISFGYLTLEQVPAELINDESELNHLYRRAVYCYAKAELSERFRDIDTTPAGSKKADALEPTTDDFRRDATRAIQRIKGTTHNVVELI